MTTNPDDWGVKNSGFVRPSYDEILEAVKADMIYLFGSDIDLSSESPVGQFAQVFARQLSQLWDDGEFTYDAAFIRSAAATNLDGLAEIRQIYRNPATYATGYVIFGRSTAASQTYTIPSGTTVATADRSITFETTADGTILTGSTSSGSVPIRAINPGSGYNLQAGTITTITTPVLGIDTVINTAAIIGGTDKELDTVFRARIKKTVPQASGTISAIESAISTIEGVTGINVTEDLDYGIIYIYVKGGSDTTIGSTLESVRPAGVSALWGRPTNAAVSVSGIASGNTTAIASAISAYLNSMSIGDDVTYGALISAALSAAGTEQLATLTATYGSQTASSLGDVITIADNAQASAGTITITED